MLRVPLLDRLADDEPDLSTETLPLRWHDAGAAAASIRDELSRLLNTRRATLTSKQGLSILDYGVDDWSAFSTTQAGDFSRIARRMAEVIARFEPRILAPQVHLARDDAEPQRLRIQVSGKLAGDSDDAPILFMDTLLGDTA
ncbi:type VI secretion system lysozyme-related protein [Silvimonas terrae]|uniref:Type VI secretion system lysozyme-related protein n=1 Tax=Silvimonas terrae TaxID=300266 RepID=A0A840RE71_9NEIS|nr:type VI secretion system baseplate subunit TssE [Silvimonas terrae]MBB5190653.1 type VI secretion system lysozyme-related protein [Silvimonas terrae]